jgi:hypothetical protein
VSTYRVGQVLYVILRKEARVFPVMVVEEVTKKTLDGVSTTYMVKVGGEAENVLPIAEVDGEFFDSAEKVSRALIERATANINQRINNAVSKSKEWYPDGFEEAQSEDVAALRKVVEPINPAPEVAQLAAELRQESEGIVVQLPDGRKAKAKIKLPPALQG